jgi:cytochrome bd-type quinol oxidase subunit 1
MRIKPLLKEYGRRPWVIAGGLRAKLLAAANIKKITRDWDIAGH